jgi:hypothetical protein
MDQQAATAGPVCGIEAVDQFIAAVPEAFAAGDRFGQPTLYGFPAAGGVDVVEAGAASPMETDDAFDVKANAFIAYCKTARPTAIVIVSEIFQIAAVGDGPLARVEYERYETDPDYRAEVLKERREALMASIQTPEKSWQVYWLIEREGEAITLGPRQVAPEQIWSGTFMNLLHKAHAQDPMVGTAAPAMAVVPFTPLPLESIDAALRARAIEASKMEIDALSAADPEDVRRHTFDFTHGGHSMRMVIGLAGGMLGLTVLTLNFGPRLPLSAYRIQLFDWLNRLTGESFLEADIKQEFKRAVDGGAYAVLLASGGRGRHGR